LVYCPQRRQIKQIFKRLFRVYAHIYYSHFEKIVDLGEEAHLNTCFKVCAALLPLRSLLVVARHPLPPVVCLTLLPLSLPQHYYYFVTEFDLVPRKVGAPLSLCPHQVARSLSHPSSSLVDDVQEMAPLEDLIQNLTGK
jgi:hypothetical protein